MYMITFPDRPLLSPEDLSQAQGAFLSFYHDSSSWSKSVTLRLEQSLESVQGILKFRINNEDFDFIRSGMKPMILNF